MSFRKEFCSSVLDVEYALEDYAGGCLWLYVVEAKKHLEEMYKVGIAEFGYTREYLDALRCSIIENLL